MTTNNKNIPQGYKYSSLGIIPQEWEVKRLGEVFDNLPSYSYSRDQMTNESQEFRYIHYGDIHKNENVNFVDLTKRELPFLLDDVGIQRKHNTLNDGDILLADASEDYDGVGKSIEIINCSGQKIIAGLHTLALRPKNNLLWIGYGKYIFRSYYGKKSIRRVSQGTKVYSISFNLISSLHIALPPLGEQQRIAEVLGVWDEAIERQTKMVALLEARKRAIMQHILTPKPHWQETKLKSYIYEHKEKPKNIAEYEIYTSSKNGLMKQTDYYGENRITNREDVDYNVIPNSFLTYRSRSDDGLFTFNKNKWAKGLISGYYPVFSSLNGDINFIVEYLNYFKTKLTKYSIGTSQLVLSFSALSEAKVSMPNIDEQQSIAEKLSTADAEIDLAKHRLDLYRTQKRALMQQLLTGKKRIKYD